MTESPLSGIRRGGGQGCSGEDDRESSARTVRGPSGRPPAPAATGEGGVHPGTVGGSRRGLRFPGELRGNAPRRIDRAAALDARQAALAEDEGLSAALYSRTPAFSRFSRYQLATDQETS